jgi:hypothetical protein
LRKNKQLWYPLFKLLLVVGVAAGLFFWLRPSEEKRIRKQFQRLSEAIAKSGDEGNASAAVKMLALGNLLHEQIDIDVRDFPYNGEQSAETLVSLVSRGRSYFRRIAVEFYDIEVMLVDHELADARCVVQVAVESDNYRDSGVRHFMASLAKVDKTWKFTGCREDELLRK